MGGCIARNGVRRNALPAPPNGRGGIAPPTALAVRYTVATWRQRDQRGRDTPPLRTMIPLRYDLAAYWRRVHRGGGCASPIDLRVPLARFLRGNRRLGVRIEANPNPQTPHWLAISGSILSSTVA
jgi:hypothetical protein